MRTSALQKCAVVPTRARISVSQTVSLNSRLEIDRENAKEDLGKASLISGQ